MTTPLFLLRCVQLGVGIRDLDLLTIAKEVRNMTSEQKTEITLLRSQGLGYADIGRRLNISRDTVKSFCRRNGLTDAEISVDDDSDKCRECGKPIKQKPKAKRQIFCCKSCRERWWSEHRNVMRKKAVYSFTCAGCGREFTAYGNRHRKYCSHACYIADRFGGGTGG